MLRSLNIAGALVVCGIGLAPSSASAQAAGPSNGLDWTFQSLQEFHDQAVAQTGWNKSRWVCQPAGPCFWQPGYWSPPRGAYVHVHPYGAVGSSGYYPPPN
jgi:hypothetical protein